MASRVVAYLHLETCGMDGLLALLMLIYETNIIATKLVKRALNFQRPFSLKINCAKKVVI